MGVTRSIGKSRSTNLVSLLALAVALSIAPGAPAQELTVPLVFNEELLSVMATDNQGERTKDIVDRIVGLSPAVQTARLRRAGGRISLFVTASGADAIPASFQFTLDKMIYYRMLTAPADVSGITEAIQEAKAAEPLIRAVGYRSDGRYSVIDVRLDMRQALEEDRRAYREAEERAAEARAAAEEQAAAEARAVEAAIKAKTAAAAAATAKAAAEARAAAANARATAAAAEAAAAKAAGEARAAAETARAAEAAAAAAARSRAPAPERPSPARGATLLSAKALGGEPAPVVDGRPSDAAWQSVPQSSVEVRGTSGNMTLTIAALWSPERLWILARWPDPNKNDQHHPWLWSKETQAYVEGPEVEDALSLAFANEGRMGDCMLGGAEAAVDLWTWGAGRTESSGYAEDATMTLGFRQLPRANSFQARNGRTVWIRREPDAGVRPYQTQVAGTYAGDLVPRYRTGLPSGSMADVRARGSWSEGVWTVEFSRRLSTGDPADAVFAPGRETFFSVAVFDSREGNDHSTSEEFSLRLE